MESRKQQRRYCQMMGYCMLLEFLAACILAAVVGYMDWRQDRRERVVEESKALLPLTQGCSKPFGCSVPELKYGTISSLKKSQAEEPGLPTAAKLSMAAFVAMVIACAGVICMEYYIGWTKVPAPPPKLPELECATWYWCS